MLLIMIIKMTSDPELHLRNVFIPRDKPSSSHPHLPHPGHCIQTISFVSHSRERIPPLLVVWLLHYHPPYRSPSSVSPVGPSFSLLTSRPSPSWKWPPTLAQSGCLPPAALSFLTVTSAYCVQVTDHSQDSSHKCMQHLCPVRRYSSSQWWLE